jgi:hypothetical protein
MKKKYLLLKQDLKMETFSNYTQTEETTRESSNKENYILPRITSHNKIFETRNGNFHNNSKINQLNETPFQEYHKRSIVLNTNNLNYCDTNSSSQPDLMNNSELVLLNTSKKKAVLTKLFTNPIEGGEELRSTIVNNEEFKPQNFRQKRQSRNKINIEKVKIENTKKILTQTISKINYPYQKKKLANGPNLLENEGIRSKLIEIHNYPLTFPDEDLFDKTRKGTKDFLLTQDTQDSMADNLKASSPLKKKKQIKIILPEQKYFCNFPNFPISSNSYVNYTKKNLNYLNDRNSERRRKNQKEPNYLYRFHNKINDESMMLTNVNNYFKENNESLKYSRNSIPKNEPTVKLNTSKLNEYIKLLNSNNPNKHLGNSVTGR